MHALGFSLSIFGGLVVFASVLGLSFVKTKEELSAGEMVEIFVLGGVIGFIRDLGRGILEGCRKRASVEFRLLVLLGGGLVLLLGGVLLIW